jgi:hypothetical protein
LKINLNLITNTPIKGIKVDITTVEASGNGEISKTALLLARRLGTGITKQK